MNRRTHADTIERTMLVNRYLLADLFKGKTVSVTGGGSWINFGLAKNLAPQGDNVGACGTTEDKPDAAP